MTLNDTELAKGRPSNFFACHEAFMSHSCAAGPPAIDEEDLMTKALFWTADRQGTLLVERESAAIL